ncbi:MAG: LacI family DNA-binding transcriptional regulator [Litoreibacter sp.]|uniref:LacI family DNA-binding transcriptional regulator n=1 Tax=Litoreibacter sp. TaxID=1969459 RepID=UPI003297A8FC
MTHRFPIKEIARQAGLGPATVDRVINNRAHVSPQTRIRVKAAIAELEGQEAQLAARGRRMFFDFVIEAPSRFSREVKTATEQVAAKINTAVCRPRFVIQEVMTEADVIKTLERIIKRGSHGVCLKARDVPAVRQSVEALAKAGIPVVTLVTDVRTPGRIAYVGLDNENAGRTAAYLVATALGQTTGTVLVMRSNDQFWGEEEREAGFAEALKQACPNLHILGASGGSGVHQETAQLMDNVSEQLSDLRAVYSVGGGNSAILDRLKGTDMIPEVYIAHDLDQDNRALIQQRELSFVLHHNLTTDLNNVFHAFLQFHGTLSGTPAFALSNIQVITPFNIPQ